ncbi:MAG: hypothetical protein HGB04_03875 [Chlorobiaceae bacterium]|nr:hypothetical protein [Chlorobiaceae bacterium]
MKQLLDDKGVADNLRRLVENSGLTQDKYAELLQIDTKSLTNYINMSSKKRAANLVAKLVPLGVNIGWYLTGEGPMWMRDLRPAEEVATRSSELLKGEAEKIQYLIDQGMVKIPQVGTLTAIKAAPASFVLGIENIEVPHYTHRIAAGLPTDSTGQDDKIALPAFLVKHPADTYVLTVTGDSMVGAGIEEGDVLIVDHAIEPENRSIVIASINGEQTVKRLLIEKDTVYLAPENLNYPITQITTEMDFRTLGVVIWVIRRAV